MVDVSCKNLRCHLESHFFDFVQSYVWLADCAITRCLGVIYMFGTPNQAT